MLFNLLGLVVGLMVIVALVALLLSAGYLRGRQVTSKGRSV